LSTIGPFGSRARLLRSAQPRDPLPHFGARVASFVFRKPTDPRTDPSCEGSILGRIGRVSFDRLSLLPAIFTQPSSPSSLATASRPVPFGGTRQENGTESPGGTSCFLSHSAVVKVPPRPLPKEKPHLSKRRSRCPGPTKTSPEGEA